MTVNATELVSKLNFVLSSRRLFEKQYIEELPQLPANSTEEQEEIKNFIFLFLKKLFPGCKIRARGASISLRLDSHIHRKANKLKEIFETDVEWRQWFEQNHERNIYRVIRENRHAFMQTSGIVIRKVEDDKVYLSVPYKLETIYSYANSGLLEFCSFMETEYEREKKLADIYDEAMRLMETEIERKEVELRERIEAELNSYKEQLYRDIYKPIAPLQESEDAVDRLFASKFSVWARQNHSRPEYAIEPTAEQMIRPGLKVKIMAPPDAEEEGWISLPPFEGYAELENYEMQGWGKVTGIDMTSERSRNGQAPIVVQESLYTEFNLEHWVHLLPPEFNEKLEITKQLRREAEAEIEPWLEQERIQKELEEENARIQEEQRAYQQEQERIRLEEERVYQQEQERIALEERIRLELEASERNAANLIDVDSVSEAADSPDEDFPLDMLIGDIDADLSEFANPDLLQQLRNQMQQQQVRATQPGLYLNNAAIPLERYVAIREETLETRRFANIQRAIAFLGQSSQNTVEVRSYYHPHEVVDTYENNPF